METPENQEISVEYEETREEKMYRNWMNSLGVDPYVNYLYTDLTDGQILFQIYEIIQPGIVDWKNRVVTRQQLSKLLPKARLQTLQNCDYAVTLGRKLGFVLVGIDGNDINKGNKLLTLALVWQMMRMYTYSLLKRLNLHEMGKPVEDKDILAWVNARLTHSGASTGISSFQDKRIRTARPVLDLIQAMNPQAINTSFVKSGDSLTEEGCMSNAKYAITTARKIGAPVYALPEDLVEVKHKMVMTVFASLMIVDMEASSGAKAAPLMTPE